MESVKLIKISILILVVFGVIGFFGFYFFKNNDNQALTVEEVNPQISMESQEILATLRELQKLEIKGDVFDSPVFKDLVDVSVIVNVEDKQRPNPFAPIPGVERLVTTGKKLPRE